MRLRDLEKIDYKDTRTNRKRPAETAASASPPTKTRGRKPATPVRGRKASSAAVADQKRTAIGRITKTSVVSPKRGPPKTPSKRGRGRPSKNGPSATAIKANASRIAPKTSSRHSLRREYEPTSPVVKIDKTTVKSSSMQQREKNAEHHTSLMHKFFRAHEDEVAHIPKKKQRKALGKMWRESSLNPKNARAEKGSGRETESDDAGLEEEEEGLDKEGTDETTDEAMVDTSEKLAEQDDGDEQTVSTKDDMDSKE